MISLMLVVCATSLSFSHDSGKKNVTSVIVKLDESLLREDEVTHTQEPLTWDAFAGEADTLSLWGALTHSGIRLRYEYRKNNDSLTALVRLLPFMDTHKSWCKTQARNGYTLAHEQRHFDIAAIVAHQLAWEIEHTNFHLVDFAATIMKLHGQFIEKLEKMQQEYDAATEHGDNLTQQLAWNEKITEDLNYSSPTQPGSVRAAKNN